MELTGGYIEINEDGWYVSKQDDLYMFSCADTEEEAISGYVLYLQCLVDTYVKADDSELTVGAKLLRNKIKSYIEVV